MINRVNMRAAIWCANRRRREREGGLEVTTQSGAS